MAAELLAQDLGRIEAITLIPGSGGIFEVRSGDRIVFDKKQQGRFPEDGEVAALFSEATA